MKRNFYDSQKGNYLVQIMIPLSNFMHSLAHGKCTVHQVCTEDSKELGVTV